jgi:hypothetical protein
MTRLATVLTAVALLAGAAALLTTASWRIALRVLLDLLTAAGLVRLSAAQTWADVATAAAIIALRQVVSATLFGSPGARSREAQDRPAPATASPGGLSRS